MVGRHTEETKNKISKALSGKNHPFYGKLGRESSFYGRHHTKEAKNKISKALSGKNNPMYGKNHTRETKEKISKSKRWVKKPFATSKYLGVYWSTGSNRWVSFITIDKKTYSKHFEYEIEAALAYNEMAKDCFGWNAILNEISEKEIIELWEKE